VREEFWNRVPLRNPNECWIWSGGKINGYGTFWAKLGAVRKSIRAHRLSYAIANGKFDESLYVCHKCDNPPCVNPSHLFLGTSYDNMWDMIRKGRHKFSCRLPGTPIKPRTVQKQDILEGFKDRGTTLGEWARTNGHPVQSAYHAAEGKTAGPKQRKIHRAMMAFLSRPIPAIEERMPHETTKVD
jgi:hypothetical protein